MSRGRAGAGAAGYRKQEEAQVSRGSAIAGDQPSTMLGARKDTEEVVSIEDIAAAQRTNCDVPSGPHQPARRGPEPLLSIALFFFLTLIHAVIRARLGAH